MTAYYNENDPKAAAWLRELIFDGQIAWGDVDERSIEDVLPSELAGYTQCHFFAGIGGWSYALRLAGWPDDRAVWTGSCPCQPFSQAGKGEGFDDSRHLWPAFGWLIDQCSPPVIFGEQVASPAGLAWLDVVLADLESSDYACAAADICAAGVGAPHIRQRLYWMAHHHHHLGRFEHAQRDGGSAQPEQQTPQRDDAGGCGVDGGVADDRIEGRRQVGEDAARSRSRSRTKGMEQRPVHGSVIELGDSSSSRGRRHTREVPRAESSVERSVRSESDVAQFASRELGIAASSGRPRLGSESAQQQLGQASKSFWSDTEWLACRDGKSRPVEPGAFPLAHGVPGRVGLLRGYGNAIVPQVAAAFIGAYLDV